MKITCDPNKREITLNDRGIDFADAALVFSGATLDFQDDRKDYGETRIITAGYLQSRMMIVVWTPRGDSRHIISIRGVAIFAKAFMGIPAQQAAKTTRPLMPAAAQAVLLHSLDTQQGVSNIILTMTRRDFVKPAFSLRKKRFVKTHALSLLGTTRLLSRSG